MPRGRLIKGILIIPERGDIMKKVGRKKKVLNVIAEAIITVVKMIWESEFLGKALVYSYVILGFMMVLKVLLVGC